MGVGVGVGGWQVVELTRTFTQAVSLPAVSYKGFPMVQLILVSPGLSTPAPGV